ncbi:class I SAM-dependent methyltransferase [Roseibacterium sp. SDUM158017]|uniref:class I SAM-dependent methyltransferase n=1 Tax=Roseicyclus salinarum TaxID=3036773 RepID=UPI0024157246|nr:class I SAM-dependent methyltransferase [Roseibacterium sp. SDUM158017]MDG4650163.1 class I SAM-dependent methyltransferase [Roseibacterium sp. SDUM158017]
MVEALKYRIRSWERAGRHPALTRAATFLWLSFQNARDRLFMGRVRDAIARDKVPGNPDGAVRAVCEDALGAGIRPMQCPRELAALIGEVDAARPRSVLEIGTARGGTLFLLCRFAAPDATIVSVDLPYGRNGGGYPRWKERDYRGFARDGQALHLLRADSHAQATVADVAALGGERGFDFILIDADHSYEGVRRDYLNYRPLLAEGGLLALHDVLPNTGDPSIDVNRFWIELENDPGVRTETIVTDPDQGMYGIGLVRG